MNELKKYLEKNNPAQNTVVEKKSNNLLVIILTFLLTTLIVGSGVFFYQKTSFESNKNEALENLEISFEEQIALLTEQIEELTKVEEEEEIEGESQENSLDGYTTYSNEAANFSFQYPSNIGLMSGNPRNNQELSISITVQNINDMPDDGPWWLSKQGAIDDMNTLEDGQFNNVYGNFLDSSKNIITIADQNAKSYLTLGRFEICDTIFERTLLFYSNNHRVTITLYGPVNDIVSSMGGYFTNNESCNNKVWAEGKRDLFYTLLLNTNAPFAAQNWFGTFDNIISSLNIGGIDNSYDSATIDLVPGLKAAFAYKYGISTNDIMITISQSTNTHARGTVTMNGESGVFLATRGNGDWGIVHDGNESIMCSVVLLYGFPFNMTSDCAG